MTKLVTDPARQAHDALRGYIYQVVRSVLAWIDLSDGEELYLEGAEDLDRIGPDGARVDQIKNTAGRITLRSPSVVDAINNYWRHAKRNPHARIRFRYLTTSAIGMERKRLTDEAMPALEQWNRARLEDTPQSRDFARTLAGDLAARSSTDSDLRAYLAGASAASVLEDLVGRIEWHAGEKDSAAAIAEIKDRLVLHGASDGLQPADSEAAFDALYRAAFDAAQDKSGPALNRAGFLRVFAAATAIQIPKQDLAALIRSAAALGTASGIAITAPTMTMEGSPPLPARYFRRRQIEMAVGRALAEGTVLLHGATGTGKTLLAASLLKQRSALWLTLRDSPPREAKARLAIARETLGAAIKTEVLVVDDLDSLSDPREIESPLASLFNKARQLGIRLILTSDRPLPPRLAQAAGLSTDHEFVMAPFAQDEIAEFLRSAGCPEELEQAWSKILEAATMGHPQLLHVRISTLAEQAFPYPEARDLLGPTAEMDRVRVEARRLISALPDEARELLYRASLLTGRMQRQRLMAVGRFEPALAETGHAIDVLAGPWLETTDDGEFRVSPLARGSAEDARGQGWAKAMHRKLAWVYLIDRKLSSWDISSIVMHCVISGRSDPLAHVLQGTHSAGDEAWAEIAEACDFYISLGLKDALPTFERPVDSFLFRVFQYRIAAARKPEIARQIAAVLDKEFAAFENEEPFRYFRFLFLSHFLSADAVAYPLATIVDRGLEFVRLAAGLFPETPTFPDVKDDDQPPRVYFLTLRLSHMVQDLDSMAELLKIITPFDPEEASLVLQALAPHRDLATLLTDRLWLGEMQSPSPRWALLCDVLRALAERARALGVAAFIPAAAATLIRTIDENLEDNRAATAEAARLASDAGDDVIFQCAMAVVVKNSGDIDRALTLWREALPRWPGEREDLGYAFAARQAAIAAAAAGDWIEARRYFVSALDRLTEEARPTFVIGLKAGSFLCRYMMNEYAEAIDDFGRLLDQLEEMQADYEEEPLRSVQRAIGGLLSALAAPPLGLSLSDAAARLVGIPSFLEPLAGSATAPPMPLDFIRQHLIDVEALHRTNLELALIQTSKVRVTRFRALRSVSQSSLFHLALRTGDFSEVVRDALDAADALVAMAASRAKGITNPLLLDETASEQWPPTLEEFPIRYLVAAVFGAAAADRLDDLPIARWRGDAEAHAEGARLRALVDIAEAFFVKAARPPWPEVQRPTGPWEDLVLAALASTIAGPMTPERLLTCHVLWIHLLAQPIIDPITASSVASLVASQWRHATRTPALFLNPRTVIPRLLAAIDAENLGWSTTHQIVSTALEGVRVAPDDPARQVIAKLAEREA